MTVAKLKAELAEVPDDVEVVLLSDSGALDSVFATYEPDLKTLYLDGAYRGDKVACQPDLFKLNEAKEQDE